MPRWLSGLDYILGLHTRPLDCSYFFTFFTTQLLMYYDISAYSVFLQHYNYITILRLIQGTIVFEARALHAMRTVLPCTQSCSNLKHTCTVTAKCHARAKCTFVNVSRGTTRTKASKTTRGFLLVTICHTIHIKTTTLRDLAQ